MANERGRGEKLRDILPILWNSYQHIYEVREAGTANGINYLMIVATFLPVFCITLYTAFDKSKFFLVPIIFQVAALLILLKRFFVRGQIPWLKLEETLSQLKDNSFDSALFAELKAVETDTLRRKEALRTIINWALIFLVFSIFLIFLAFFFVILKGTICLYIAMVLLVLAFSLLWLFYNQIPKSKVTEEETQFKKKIEKWLRGSTEGETVDSGAVENEEKQ